EILRRIERDGLILNWFSVSVSLGRMQIVYPSFTASAQARAGDVHPSPGAVLDDHRLSPVLLQLVRQRANEHVTGPARSVGGDDPYRLARIGLGSRRRCGEDRRSHRDEQETWRFHQALAELRVCISPSADA